MSPGRLSRARSAGAAGRPGGRLLRRVRGGGTDQAATAPASRRQRPRLDRQPRDASVPVVVALERRVVAIPARPRPRPRPHQGRI